jgi:hypothetical protein
MGEHRQGRGGGEWGVGRGTKGQGEHTERGRGKGNGGNTEGGGGVLKGKRDGQKLEQVRGGWKGYRQKRGGDHWDRLVVVRRGTSILGGGGGGEAGADFGWFEGIQVEIKKGERWSKWKGHFSPVQV